MFDRKHETSEQFFHRPEICMFGAVVQIPTSNGDHSISFILTSDYKYNTSKQRFIWYINNIDYRVKDNKFVFVALDKVIKVVMERSAELGFAVQQIVEKVIFNIHIFTLLF